MKFIIFLLLVFIPCGLIAQDSVKMIHYITIRDSCSKRKDKLDKILRAKKAEDMPPPKLLKLMAEFDLCLDCMFNYRDSIEAIENKKPGN